MAASPVGSAEGRSPPRPASEIRFKEIAHYVGLSLLRNPSLTRGVPKALKSLTDRSFEPLPATPSMDPPLEVLRDGDLPSIHQHGRSERLKSQLEWLRAEQRAERDQLRKLESCLSDSRLLEQRARQRLAKHQEMHILHAQRATELEHKIVQLQEKLGSSEGAPRPLRESSPPHDSHAGDSLGERSSPWLESRGASGATSEDGPRRPTGLLAQSAQRAVAAASPAAAAAQHARAARSYSSTGFFEVTGSQDLQLNESMGALGLVELDPGPPQRPAALSRTASAPGFSVSSSPPMRSRRMELADLPPKLSPAEEQEEREACRMLVREALKERAGGTREAFRKLDLNGSGNVSLQEFADGITRLGVDWQHITGLKRPRDLFALFDEEKDAIITFKKLFPDESVETHARPSTPDFCRAYFDSRFHHMKGPCWSPSNPEEELKLIVDASQLNDDAAEKRKWMRSTMRRLKTRGKSDSRCREIVAMHLPRGTGPRDREGVNSFTLVDLKACRKNYNDEVNLPMRRMWKVVGDYKDQRREQKRIYDRLYSVTKALQQRQEQEEALNSLAQGGTFSILKANQDSRNAQNLHAKLAEQCDMEEHEVDDLHKDFLKFADTGEMLGKKGFSRLLQALLGGHALPEAEVDVWWEQVDKVATSDGKAKDESRSKSASGHEEAASSAGSPKNFLVQLDFKLATPGAKDGSIKKAHTRVQCNFEQFCTWWAEAEVRHS